MAKRKDVPQARATPTALTDEPGVKWPGGQECSLLSCADPVPMRSILREYDYSFLQLCGFSLLWTLGLIAIFALLWMA
jgi:hypothetical protein